MQQVYIQEVDTCMTTRLPGELCQYSEQCATIEPGAFCQRLRCKCALGMKFDGNSCTFTDPKCAVHGYVWVPEMDECMQVLSPGTDGCTHSIQCSTVADNAYCFRHKCTCPDNLIPVDGTCGEQCPTRMTFSAVIGQCIPVIKPGGKCQYSSQCQTDDNEMICVRGCSSTQIEHKDKCYDQILPGQSCIVDSQCMGGFRCVKNICVCPSSMMIRNGLCRQRKVAPMQSCNYGQVCLGGSFCHAGICVCPAGFIKMNEECVLRATVPPSSTCNSAVRCGGGSICIADICECPDFKEPVNGICEMSPAGVNAYLLLEYYWEIPVQLEMSDVWAVHPVFLAYANVHLEQCRNMANAYQNEKFPLVLVVNPLRLALDLQLALKAFARWGMSLPHIRRCREQLCKWRILRRRINMSSIENYEETCMNGETCIDNLLCIDGICQCPQGMFSSSGQCILTTTDSLVKCSNSSQCTGNSYCDHQSGLCICQGLCHCPAGEIFTGGRCQMVFAEAGESCLNGETCTSNYVCINGSCSCPDGEISRNGNCVTEDTEIKKYTRYQEQSVFTLPPQQVFNRSGNMLNESLNGTVINVNRITIRLNRCENSNDCKGGSYCLGYQCICPFNMIMKDGLCLEMSQNSYEISLDSDSALFTALPLIDASIERIPSSPQTEMIVNISGGVCNETTLCLFFSICHNGICKCPLGTGISDTECKFTIDEKKILLPCINESAD
ncbi:EB module [Onchocerca flexuosa]|uniref:EB module n=1 Tax=Onchocerca flexuosa TaxID=387005 RepID=A0A238BJ37_9BILA|nr:EB module [Onchocerca flexuosa]